MPGLSLTTAAAARRARPGFGTLSPAGQISVIFVVAAAAVTLVVGARAVGSIPWQAAAGLFGLSVLANAAGVVTRPGRGLARLRLPYVTSILSILLVGPWPSVPIAVAGAWSAVAIRNRDARPGYRTLFTLGATAVGVAAAGLVSRGMLTLLPAGLWPALGAGMGAATAYFLVMAGLEALVFPAPLDRERRAAVEARILASAPDFYIGAAAAVLAAEIVRGQQQWWAVSFAIPAYLVYRSYQAHADRLAADRLKVEEMADVHLAMVRRLAEAIETRDNTTQAQMERIQAYAEGLARALSMAERDVNAVRMAALLHDIGNLAVPREILSKPGRLTYEEYDRLKIHPRVGADIISEVPFPYPVAPLVLSHHERWDGRGYPSGLKGKEIPLGARILAVVDCFTSMRTDRPYRPSRTYAEAMATLRENGGSTLDPDLVEKFIEILPAIESRFHAPSPESRADDAGAPQAQPNAASKGLADIAVAHLEEQVLRDIDQSLNASLRVSDTVSLISACLVKRMPHDACALFLLDPTSGLFICAHAVGSHQDALRGTTAASAQSLAAQVPTAQASVLGAPTRLQSAAVASLVNEEGTIGALAVYDVERGAYTEEDRRFLSQLATHAAHGIARAQVFEQTQEQSLTDVLTGLPNRRYYEQHLAREIARIQRHGGQLSLLVLDMDGFKQINDEFGHQAGDSALREVAQALRGCLRVYDVCARFAGDEFVIVLGDCDAAQAERRRIDVQRAVASLWVEPVPGRVVHLSVSAGASTLPDDADTADGAFEAADRRMYHDKGRRKRLGSEQEALASDCLWQ